MFTDEKRLQLRKALLAETTDWEGAAREYTFVDVARAATREQLNEASLGRIFAHIQQTKAKSWAILTSWRSLWSQQAVTPGTTPAQAQATNEANWSALLGTVRNENLGYIKLLGHWLECTLPDTAYESCPKDKLVKSTEPSIFVPGMSLQMARQLARRFNQDAFIYVGPETTNKVAGVYTQSGKMTDYGPFHPNRIAQAYSQIKKNSKMTNLDTQQAGPAFAFQHGPEVSEPPAIDSPLMPEDFHFEYPPQAFHEASIAQAFRLPKK